MKVKNKIVINFIFVSLLILFIMLSIFTYYYILSRTTQEGKGHLWLSEKLTELGELTNQYLADPFPLNRELWNTKVMAIMIKIKAQEELNLSGITLDEAEELVKHFQRLEALQSEKDELEQTDPRAPTIEKLNLEIGEESRKLTQLLTAMALKPIQFLQHNYSRIEQSKIYFLALLSIMLILLLLTFSLYFFGVVKRLNDTLQRFVNGAEKVSQGDLDYRIQMKSKDEFSFMGKMFNKMVENLKQLNRKLQYREDIFIKIAETAQDLIFIKDAEFRYTFVNPAMAKLFKCTQEQLIGKKPKEIFHERDIVNIAEADLPVLLEGKVTNLIRTVNIANNLITLHTIQVPLKNKNGEITGMCGIARDITAIKNTEQELESLNQQLMDKNKELEQIIYATSHDLRSPLVNIQGFSQELVYSLDKLTTLLGQEKFPESLKIEMDNILSNEIPAWCEYIMTSIKKMNSLLGGLLKISRTGRTTLNLQNIDMNRLMEEIVTSLEYQILEKKITVTIEELPPCYSDSSQTNQVFSNIIDNAIKYMDPARKGSINITGFKRGSFTIYCVEDNGIGIKKNQHDKIFEVFYRLNPDTAEGEGIGLTLVKKILSRLNGKIWLESTPGRGSLFFIKLPAERV